MLHAVLLLAPAGAGAGAGPPPRPEGFDAFCRDMDASLREMGVGDLAVPRRMRGIGEAFYGRQAAYRAALADPDDVAACRGARAQCICRRARGRTARRGWRPMCGRAVRELAARTPDALRAGAGRLSRSRERCGAERCRMRTMTTMTKRERLSETSLERAGRAARGAGDRTAPRARRRRADARRDREARRAACRCRALRPCSRSRRRGRDGLHVTGPCLGDGRPDLRGDARADRERDRRGDRPGVRTGAARSRPTTAARERDRCADDGAGAADRRRGRSRRARDRIPHSRHRSLSAQAGGGLRGPVGRATLGQAVRRAGGAEERAEADAAADNCPLLCPLPTRYSSIHAP